MSTIDRDDLRLRAVLPRNPKISHFAAQTPGNHRWNCDICREWCYESDPCECCRPALDWDDVITLCDELDALQAERDTLESQMLAALTAARGYRERAERAEAITQQDFQLRFRSREETT